MALRSSPVWKKNKMAHEQNILQKKNKKQEHVLENASNKALHVGHAVRATLSLDAQFFFPYPTPQVSSHFDWVCLLILVKFSGTAKSHLCSTLFWEVFTAFNCITFATLRNQSSSIQQEYLLMFTCLGHIVRCQNIWNFGRTRNNSLLLWRLDTAILK